jgi:Ran GTPase-activating protein (RanGAP) involved in mRNA processing and transport
LRLLPTLRDISLFSNQIGDQGLAALIAQPMAGVFESLESLDISDSHVTDAGCAILAAALRGGALPALERVDSQGPRCTTQSASSHLFAARRGLGPI